MLSPIKNSFNQKYLRVLRILRHAEAFNHLNRNTKKKLIWHLAKFTDQREIPFWYILENLCLQNAKIWLFFEFAKLSGWSRRVSDLEVTIIYITKAINREENLYRIYNISFRKRISDRTSSFFILCK